MLSGSLATRYYVHGDRHETSPVLYYCAQCDAFEPTEHFAEPLHVKARAERFEASLATWRRYAKRRRSGFRRPGNPENIVGNDAAADIRAARESRSPFYRWLLRQAGRDDVIGDLAADAKTDKTFPADAGELYSLKAHLLRRNACGEAFVALLSRIDPCCFEGVGRVAARWRTPPFLTRHAAHGAGRPWRRR